MRDTFPLLGVVVGLFFVLVLCGGCFTATFADEPQVDHSSQLVDRDGFLLWTTDTTLKLAGDDTCTLRTDRKVQTYWVRGLDVKGVGLKVHIVVETAGKQRFEEGTTASDPITVRGKVYYKLTGGRRVRSNACQ